MIVCLLFPPQLIFLYCAGFLCILVVLFPLVADQIISLNFTTFFLSPFFFFFFFHLPAARKARNSLTSFDISLLPHFNINCLPEEKQVWG